MISYLAIVMQILMIFMNHCATVGYEKKCPYWDHKNNKADSDWYYTSGASIPQSEVIG